MKPPLPFSIQIPMTGPTASREEPRYERTLMGIPLTVAHDEPDVHQARRLRDLPMYAGRRDVVGHPARVDREVPHTAEEVVLVDVPLCTSATRDIRIRIYWVTPVRTTGARCRERVPMTAIPLKLDAARSVGGALASPMICE